MSEVVRVAIGQPGAPGASAYQLAVSNGFVGDEAAWLESLQGEPGADSTVPGSPGTAATITVGTVTTGAPGSNVEVTNVGTSSAAILDFTIPEGEPGADAEGGGGAWGEITGTLSDQTDLASALAGKSATGHTHAQSDVTGLVSALAAKADDAATTTALAGKAATSHTHTASNVTDFNTAADARVVAGITGKLDTSAAPELIRDTIGTALVAGNGIALTVNDAGDTITVAATSAVNAQTGTTYTIVLSDAGKLVTLNNSSGVTVTLPQDSSVAVAVGDRIDFIGLGTGLVTFAAGTGATATATPSLVTRARYSGATAVKVAANTWVVLGDMA